MKVKARSLLSEVKFSTARSGGAGGQHVNKVETKVTLHFDVANSNILTETQKQRILEKLGSRTTKDGVLVISSDSKRSQLQNKEAVWAKLDKLLAKAFKVEKKRKKTKPTKASKEKRLQSKKQQSEKKKWRKKI